MKHSRHPTSHAGSAKMIAIPMSSTPMFLIRSNIESRVCDGARVGNSPASILRWGGICG